MLGRSGGRGSGISVLAARHDDDDDDDEEHPSGFELRELNPPFTTITQMSLQL